VCLAIVFITLCLISNDVPALASSTRGHKVSDVRYSISFYLPAAWQHPVITRPAVSTTKLLVKDIVGTTVKGVVQVQVLSGRHTNVAEIANGLLASTPGATILASRVVEFHLGRAEQLEFSIRSGTAVVYGTAESFYLHHLTYIVAFDASTAETNRVTRDAVMSSWGS
jgi:hypothetical protein